MSEEKKKKKKKSDLLCWKFEGNKLVKRKWWPAIKIPVGGRINILT